MKTLARLLSLLSIVLSLLTTIKLPDGRAVRLVLPKIVAAALSPFVALSGAVGALLGLVWRDRFAAGIGLLGSALSLRHIARVTAPRDPFAESFGKDWPQQIPPTLQMRLRPKRYSPLPFNPPLLDFERDIAIATRSETGEALLADLWQPPSAIPRSGLAMIYLHGSAWYYLDKDLSTRPFFSYLARQGHVILDVAYTLAPKTDLPGMVADVRRAVAWTKTNAAQYAVNPDKIVLMGASAGGHLALLAAYTAYLSLFQPEAIQGIDPSVCGVVSYYGIIDLSAEHYRLKHLPITGRYWEYLLRYLEILTPGRQIYHPSELLPGLLGGTPEQVPELYRLASPFTYAGPHCPPTLQVSGAHDFAVDVEQHRRLHHALRAAGVRSAHVVLPDTEHAFDMFFPRWAPAAQAALYNLERFLALLAS